VALFLFLAPQYKVFLVWFDSAGQDVLGFCGTFNSYPDIVRSFKSRRMRLSECAACREK
jgi:hypothetical protein